jgi:hypothetical protein
MKNPIQPSVSLTVPDPIKGGEVTFELLFDFEAIARAEDVTGRALFSALSRRVVDHPTINLARAMLFAFLLPTQPQIAFTEASAFVTQKTADFIWNKLIEAWVVAIPGFDSWLSEQEAWRSRLPDATGSMIPSNIPPLGSSQGSAI